MQYFSDGVLLPTHIQVDLSFFTDVWTAGLIILIKAKGRFKMAAQQSRLAVISKRQNHFCYFYIIGVNRTEP